MSVIQKTIDDITRTKTSLDGTERLPARDGTGDFKITAQNLIEFSTKLQGDGWTPCLSETFVYASADSPTFTATVAGDKRSKYSKGMKLKLEQTQALSAYWTFNSSSAADVGSVTMADIGTPTYTAGKFGNALTLDGSTDALSITDTSLLKPTGNFTFGCWIKIANATTYNAIFQSFRTLASVISGIQILTDITTGFPYINIGLNTGTVLGVDYYSVSGSVNICDNNYHYLVVTFKDQLIQIYVDGKLSGSGYSLPPVYDATTYTRIGVSTVDGTTNNFWVPGQIDDLFLINGYALDEETIKAKYDAQTAQGTSDITVTKKFILTDISYSAPNTTLTMYGGTDFALSNGTISNPYYSMVAQPFGFNRNPDKWSVVFYSFANAVVSSPVSGTIYNPGSIQLLVPIGKWKVRKVNSLQAVTTGSMDIFMALSESASANVNAFLISSHYIYLNHETSVFGEAEKELYVKRTFYLILTTITSGTTSMALKGASSPIILKATSVYL